MKALAALVLLAAVGCAPSADLRAPLPERPTARGQLAIVRLGDVAVRPGDEDRVGDYARGFWDLLRAELSEHYAFDAVRYVDAPAGLDAPARRVLVERAPLGSQAQGWARYTLRVPDDPAALAPDADVVVVIDTVQIAQGVAGNPLVLGVRNGPFRETGPFPSGRGVTVAADALVYRQGQSAPAGAARLSVYGRGVPEAYADGQVERAVVSFAERLALHGGFVRR